MMQVAVNCLVNDARRKFVCASIGCRVRRSVTPYPRRKTGCPSWMTRTAAPGAALDFNAEKMASIWEEGTWAVPRIAGRIIARASKKAANGGLKSDSSRLNVENSRHDSTARIGDF